MKSVFFVILLFLGFGLQAQEFSKEKLMTMSDEELLEAFNKVDNDSLKAEAVVRVYLNRAKNEKDTIKMARGYDRLARIFHAKKNIAMADSLITLTKNWSHKTYPALGYILKSYEYHKTNDLILKTKYAQIAYDLAIANDNISQQIYISDQLIRLKSVWGDKLKALELQKIRHGLMSRSDYFKKIDESTRKEAKVETDILHLENELSSIQNFVLCYLNLRELDSAKIFIKEGLKKASLYNGYNNDKNTYTLWLTEASIEVEYYSNNFVNSISRSDSLLNNTKISLPEKSIQNLNLFKGLSYIELGEWERGIKCLKIADSILSNDVSSSIRPYQRVLFEKLMGYHRDKRDLKGEIRYLNKLLFVDSIFKRNYQFFEPDIIRNFQTPKLLREKDVLIKELKSENEQSRDIFWIGLCTLVLSVLVIGYYFNRQLVFRKRFESLIEEKPRNNRKGAEINSKLMELPTKIIDTIMLNLDEFELNRQFLSQKVSLTELASTFNTNPRYLSKVINLQKDKNFSQYINDLRVDHALKELTENTMFRKYTIKAIASECGFKSSESFSKAFYKRHGIFPSYYIKKIQGLNS